MPDLLVNVDVPDLAAAERFYTAALGLTVGRRFGDGGTELLGLAAPLYLLATAPGSPPFAGARTADARRFERHWTPVHLDLAVPDLEAALARAEAAGARRESDVLQRRWGRMVVLADPFGNGFCLLQFEGGGYDAIATGRG
jgi:lactoylglutathione lyase